VLAASNARSAIINVDRAHALLDWRAQSSVDEAIATALGWADRRQEILGYE